MPSVLIRTPHRSPWLELHDPAATLVAGRPDEVTGVLEAAQRAADRGSLVAGFVAYEAAAAFDLAVHQPSTGLPLAWSLRDERGRRVVEFEPGTGLWGADEDGGHARLLSFADTCTDTPAQ